uniref:dUTPase-like domain-containing protein n=1 Tax=Accipiter nisus TaxID=211598 RepID=A0A8B9N6U8_9AVES
KPCSWRGIRSCAPQNYKGPASYGADESVVSQLKQYRVTDLRSATSASAGLDLAVATVVLNTPKEIKVVSTGIWGGLPKGLVGILVLTGIIDSDYQGDLKMMIIILFGYHKIQSMLPWKYLGWVLSE